MLQEGVHDGVLEADYHADPCPEPSLSASIMGKLLDDSPRHAWTHHPRLNPEWATSTTTQEADIGTACHKILFGFWNDVVAVDAPDWRKKEAQEQRSSARSEGKVALLRHQYAVALAMADELRYDLLNHDEASDAFTDGRPEQVMIWREDNGIWCRARIDWLPNQRGGWIDDYKTTGGSARAEVWSRKLYDFGGELQAAFYARGYKRLFGVAPAGFRFVVQEQDPPCASSVIVMDDSGWSFANERVEEGIHLWGECLRRGTARLAWPAYPRRIAYVSPPAWVEYRWADKKVNNEALLYRADDHPQGRIAPPEVLLLAGFGSKEDR